MAPFNPMSDLPDLTGRVAFISGATSGLGYATALWLLRKGAKVYIGARNESKAVAVLGKLEREGLGPGNGTPIYHKLDLANPKDAKESAEEFLKREERLDILVNNAALLAKPFELGPLGIQDIVIVNHISPFLFTSILLPLLKKTALLPNADVRIVNVSSYGHNFAINVKFEEKEDFNGPNRENGPKDNVNRYGYTKLMNILWTKELSRRLKMSVDDGGSRIMCLSLHPGTVATEGITKWLMSFIWPVNYLLNAAYYLFSYTADKASGTILIAAAAPNVRSERSEHDGAYLIPIGKIGKVSKDASDEKKQADLWNLTERILSDEIL